ncbi:MAG: ATP-binding protein [Fulvivirga sp.]
MEMLQSIQGWMLQNHQRNKGLNLSKLRVAFFIGLSFFFYQISAQTPYLDSLRNIDQSGKPDTVIFQILNLQATRSDSPDSALKYSKKFYELTKEVEGDWRMRALQTLGNAYEEIGNHELAIKYYFEALEIAKTISNSDEAMMSINIADTYTGIEAYEKGKLSYHTAINIFEQTPSLSNYDSTFLTASYVNLGDLYLIQEAYDSALHYFQQAQYLAELLDRQYYLAIIRGNIAIAYANLGNDTNAEDEILKAVTFLEGQGEWNTAVEFLQYMVDIYRERQEYQTAANYATRGYELAKQHGYKRELQNISFKLYEIKKLQNEPSEALKYHEVYAQYRDSVINRETIQRIADQRTEFEVGQKQAEVDLLTAEKRTQQVILFSTAGGALFVVILLGLVYKNYRDKNRINKVLEDQKAQLEALNSTKDKFFSIISHDLRGPVSAFSGITRLIKHAVQNKEHDDLIEISDHIDESVEHLSGLLDNLLSWAMQQQGHFPNVPEKLNLKALTSEIKGIFSNMADAKKIDLKVNVQDGINLWADKNTSMTILRNLVNNALKFTKSGGEVKVAAEQHENMAVITVSDTGIGMSEDKIETLFQLQGTKSDFGTSGEKGLGLGLQLVYEFVELNNGTIEVQSEEGRGTQFTIQLPLFESVSQGLLHN